MNLQDFNSIIHQLNDCDNFLQGKAHSNHLAEIAKAAANREILERRNNLLERLRDAGLNLEA